VRAPHHEQARERARSNERDAKREHHATKRDVFEARGQGFTWSAIDPRSAHQRSTTSIAIVDILRTLDGYVHVAGDGTSLAMEHLMMRAKALLTSAVLLAVVVTAGTSDAGPKKPKPPKEPKPVATEEAAPFDKAVAASVLSSVDLVKCKSTNAPRGEGHIVVTFTPAGTATEAVVDKGPWLGTPVAKCIAKEFKKAKVPAFSGDGVQVGKSFRFE
jgi:hypothetical protein